MNNKLAYVLFKEYATDVSPSKFPGFIMRIKSLEAKFEIDLTPIAEKLLHSRAASVIPRRMAFVFQMLGHLAAAQKKVGKDVSLDWIEAEIQKYKEQFK